MTTFILIVSLNAVDPILSSHLHITSTAHKRQDEEFDWFEDLVCVPVFTFFASYQFLQVQWSCEVLVIVDFNWIDLDVI